MSTKEAQVTSTQNADGTTTLSLKLSEMSVDQLVKANQALGRQRDSINEQMRYINGLVAAKLKEQRVAHLKAEIAKIEAGVEVPPTTRNAAAPGALIEARVKSV